MGNLSRKGDILRTYSIIPGKLYQSGKFLELPLETKINELQKLGIKIVVNLWTTPDKELQDAFPYYYHLPIPDGILKKQRVLLNFAKEISQLAEKENCAVLSHCYSGRNRSGLFSALFSMEVLNISGIESVDLIRERRPNSLTNENFVYFLRGLKGCKNMPLQENKKDTSISTKIFLVLGPSGSGKTTWIEKEILAGEPTKDGKFEEVDVSISEKSKTLLYGKYNVDKRCKGCDTLSMSIINKLLSSLEGAIASQQFKSIVIDGDRVNNEKTIQFLSKYKENVEVVFIDTPLETIYSRLPNCNKQFVKTTFTKTRNTIQKCSTLGFKINHIKIARSSFFDKIKAKSK